MSILSLLSKHSPPCPKNTLYSTSFSFSSFTLFPVTRYQLIAQRAQHSLRKNNNGRPRMIAASELPLPPPRQPALFTTKLPGDELSAGGAGGNNVPPSLLRTPRMVRGASFSYVPPEDQSKGASLLGWNPAMAECIGMKKTKADQWTETERDNLIKVLTGGSLPEGANSWAHCYGGHQFGYYAGQLGDGRAISLYETVNAKTDDLWELQLKGAGKTPYSRFADGFAVLRSSIREYLCAEAVAALNVPTSRSLAIVTTETEVVREDGPEPGSIVCRVAPSWIRFGSFEIFHYRQDFKNLRTLAEFVCSDVYHLETENTIHIPAKQSEQTKQSEETEQTDKEASDQESSPPEPMVFNRFARLLLKVAERTAVMVSGWQAIGFCHGVMNTDNMSILGLTIDYGPYAFLDIYDPTWICNHSDNQGRYAYQEQPGVCLWNLTKLAITLEHLIGAGEKVDDADWMAAQQSNPELLQGLRDKGATMVVEILGSFRDAFMVDYRRRMNEKFGLTDDVQDSDLTAIVVPALSWMDEFEVDYHQFFRALAEFEVPLNKETDSHNVSKEQMETLVRKVLPAEAWSLRRRDAVFELQDQWLPAYQARILSSELADVSDNLKRRDKMNNINPAFVLRNWIAQRVIEQVTEDPIKGAALMEDVLDMCQHPFGQPSTPKQLTSENSCVVVKNSDGLERYGEFVGPVPSWGQGIQCSCSS